MKALFCTIALFFLSQTISFAESDTSWSLGRSWISNSGGGYAVESMHIEEQKKFDSIWAISFYDVKPPQIEFSNYSILKINIGLSCKGYSYRFKWSMTKDSIIITVVEYLEKKPKVLIQVKPCIFLEIPNNLYVINVSLIPHKHRITKYPK